MNDKQLVHEAIARSGCKCTAIVAERPGVFDFAVNAAGNEIVVRLASNAAASDHSQLATMVTQGDFTCAFLVHSDEHSPPAGDIPTYPLSRIDELAALLAKESPP